LTVAVSQDLIEALRTTIIQVEQTAGLSADDPGLLALKRILVQKIANIEIARAAGSASSTEALGSSDEAASDSPYLPFQSSEAA
jgi:hypothetical protein